MKSFNNDLHADSKGNGLLEGVSLSKTSNLASMIGTAPENYGESSRLDFGRSGGDIGPTIYRLLLERSESGSQVGLKDGRSSRHLRP